MFGRQFLSRFFRPRTSPSRVAALAAVSFIAAVFSACTYQVTFNVIDAATGEPIEGVEISASIERSQQTFEDKLLHDAAYMREAHSDEAGAVIAVVQTSNASYIRFEKDGYHVLELHDALGFTHQIPTATFLDRFPMVSRTGTRQYDVFLTPNWALPMGEQTATFPVFLY